MNLHQRSLRKIRVGGKTKPELLADLQAKGIELNEAAKILFRHDAFETTAQATIVQVAEVSVKELGCPEGAAFSEICRRAAEGGLWLCPLELAPHLRLQFLDQAEGHGGQPEVKHQAPPGALIVASPPLADDDAVPKGFYLRRIAGVLWLRGYWSSADHVCGPEETYVFCSPSAPDT